METILIRPKNQSQLEAVKSFAIALKLEYEVMPSDGTYDPDFVNKVIQGREDIKNGKGLRIAVKDLWK